jgi:hypothetical protein
MAVSTKWKKGLSSLKEESLNAFLSFSEGVFLNVIGINVDLTSDLQAWELWTEESRHMSSPDIKQS